MALVDSRGMNHIAGGIAAAVALPVGVFALNLPFVLMVPIALGIYAGVALLLAPRRAIDRIDPERVGRAQASLVAGLIEDGEGVVARLEDAAGKLATKDVAAKVAHMAKVAQSILDRLAGEPGKLPAMRRFLTYYLPRAADLAEGMVVVEGLKAGDPKRRADLEDMLGKLDHAFTYYSDSFAQAELDVLDVELKLIARSLSEDIAMPQTSASQTSAPQPSATPGRKGAR